MQLTLVRHGETEWNRLRKCQGTSDIPLNETGRGQAKKLAESLRNEKIDAVFSSGLKRASETAEEIAGHHRLEVGIDERFREMDQGDFEGVEFSVIRERHSDKLKMWTENPESFRIPGGESLPEVQRRAMRGIAGIQKSWGSSSVVIVSHNLTIVSLLCKFSGVSVGRFRDFTIDASSKTVVMCDAPRYVISLLNDTSHLDGAAEKGGRQ